ncbi:helix-turn-helix domain-containing protein [Actinomadura macra]|uniref:helix-turn-helix domain-containing protein n=1 Tax=Actinomadura macra TaxID=46164 RepID=UPI000B21B955|nr:helix-turn-helix domain-containing protein [Actinomadura macra]
MARWAELRGEYVEPRELAQCLRNIVDQYQLSVRQLEQRMPYSKSVISERMSGERRPAWKFVEALTKACAGGDAEARARLNARAREKWEAADPTRLTPVAEDVPVAADIDQLVKRIVEGLREPSPDQAQPAGGRPFLGAIGPFEGPVPERNPYFTGRTGLLDRLSAGFSTGRVQVVYGLLGVGKTQLAVEYARGPGSGYDLVAWIPAGEPSLAGSSLAALASRLGLEFSGSMHIMKAARAVLAALRDGAFDGRWLLVFDNAGHVTDELLKLIPRGRGHVLITSRDPAWSVADGVGGAVEVEGFSRAESTEFFERRLRQGLDERRYDAADADRLAEALGDLPLGLEQAATLLDRFPRLRIADYLVRLSREPGRALNVAAPAGYPVTLKIAWGLAANKLGTRSPEAINLLRHCARSPVDPVPIPGADSAESATESGAELTALLADRFGAVEELGRSGLAYVDDDAIRVHPLVRALVLEELSGPAAGVEAVRET